MAPAVLLVTCVTALLHPTGPARGVTTVEPARRALLAIGGSLLLSARPRQAVARASLETPEVRGLDTPEAQQVVKRFTKLATGVRFAELKQGTGAEVGAGSTAVCQWVLRRADGYFVDSSEKHNFAPVRLTIGAHELGTLDDALVGIRAGGVRRVLVPLAQAGTAAQISGKLELEFGPSRQLARQFNRPDPDNVFIYELQVDKVQPAV